MFKSIFSRYFALTSLVVVISFACMCVTQSLLSSRYWVEENKKLLEENACEVATNLHVKTGIGSYVLDEKYTAGLLNSKAGTINATFFIADSSGHLLYGSTNADESLYNATLSEAVLSRLNGVSYFEVGTLDGLYASQQYIAAYPIVVNGTRIGYVFAVSSAEALGRYLSANLKVFLWAALVVLALTFFVLYVVTYRMVRPLRLMAAVARSYGTGDFSHRIEVRGNDEVAQLASSLNSMATSLASMEGMHRSFVANVSHELKTPMTTIAGFIDGILDGTIPADKRDQYLRVVSDEVRRLSRLVKSMLDLSRIDNGALKLQPMAYDLTEQVCNTLFLFEQRVEEKHLDVQGLEDCESVDVLADFDLIGQVVYNLVDNAIKFINEDGTLTLRVRRQDNRAYVTVGNTGVGIPSQEMPHIFERFYKGDKSRSLDKNGMGLGLYIVKTVINLHHGEICVRSVEGEYCEFEFWLPLPVLSADTAPKRYKDG